MLLPAGSSRQGETWVFKDWWVIDFILGIPWFPFSLGSQRTMPPAGRKCFSHQREEADCGHWFP